jgi:hypothetical protein
MSGFNEEVHFNYKAEHCDFISDLWITYDNETKTVIWKISNSYSEESSIRTKTYKTEYGAYNRFLLSIAQAIRGDWPLIEWKAGDYAVFPAKAVEQIVSAVIL